MSMTASGAALRALPYMVKAVKKLAEPATQDKLVSSLKHYRAIPKLSWRQRSRLKKAIGSEAAANALIDQDPATLAAVVATTLKEPETGRPRRIAEALIAEYPGCVDGAQQAIAMAYQLRLIRHALTTQGLQLDGIGQNLAAVHRMVASDPGRIDPEVLLNGPLDGLDLHADYRRVEDLAGTDPAGAAEQLWAMIIRIDDAGYPLLTRRFRREFADLLAQAGQLERAADAWLPMVDDYLTGGFGIGHHDACNSWEYMATQEGAPGWLRARRAAVIMLDHCGMGDQRPSSAIAVAIAAVDTGDPAGSVWLMHAAELALADRAIDVVEGHRQRLLAAAGTAVDPMVAVRLRLAVADATGDDGLWEQLLDATIPGSPATPAEVAALILARHGRHLLRAGTLDGAVTAYRNALGRASHVQNWQDAASWAGSALVALKQAQSIDFRLLERLSGQESALRDAGPGSLINVGYDMRGSAMEKLLESVGGNAVRARSARIDLRRLLKRSIILGAVNNELDAHRLLSRMYLQVKAIDDAVEHAVAATEVTLAGQAAMKLTSYYDCLAAARSPMPNIRASALQAAAGQADYIPDCLVASWVSIAIDEAASRYAAAMGPDLYVQAFEVLRRLANRIPEDLVPDVLDLVADRLPDDYAFLGDQIAGILVGLGRTTTATHQGRVADLIATTFESADDVAYLISDSARSLTAPLRMIAERLRILLEPGREYSLGRRCAALTLAVIDDDSPELGAYAEAEVAKQLPDPATGRPAGSAGNCEDAAILAGSLSIDRRAELARYCCTQVVGGGDDNSRMQYANACRLAGEGLPGGIRAELFDQLYPQRRPPESMHPGDVMRRAMENPFAFIRFTSHSSGRLRRQIAKALAALATDHDRQDRLWKATQPLAVSGSTIDVKTVGDVGFALAKAGYTAELPWAAMASGADTEMRGLAAALIPFMPGLDAEAETVIAMARDTHQPVRRELAQAIATIRQSGSAHPLHQAGWIDPALEILGSDASFLVRQIATRTATAST